MIAASDPQDFIPSGRQQAFKHPGPLNFLKKNLLADDFLLDKLEKVSLVDSKHEEWWTLRKVPNILGTESSSEAEFDPKCYGDSNLNKSYSETLEDSYSIKSTDGSFKFKKRISDQYPKKATQRTSNASDASKCSSSNKSVGGGAVSYNKPSEFSSKLEQGYMEEELYIKDNTVIWSRGLLNNFDNVDNARKVVCSFTSSLPIKSALWCSFVMERPAYDLNLDIKGTSNVTGLIPSVCIVDSENIKVFTEKGEDFVVALPFKIGSVWKCKFGLLIEKETTEYNADKSSIFRGKSSLYSLLHPLDDLCPVIINQNFQVRFLNNSHLKIVFTSEDPSICVVYDAGSRQHSVYKIRRTKQVEIFDLPDRSLDCGTSAMSSSNKLKSRLSMWENVKNSSYMPTPSPATSRLGTYSTPSTVHNSKSLNSMATISRCQSPATSTHGSPWLLDNKTHSFVNIPDNLSGHPNCSTTDFSTAGSHLAAPVVCLEHLWTENYNGDTESGSATKVFLSDDLAGQSYLCYLVNSKLSMVKMDSMNSSYISFGMSTSISAKDAAPIPQLHMIAILEHTLNVTLYSGLTSVGKLHICGTLVRHTPSPFVRPSVALFSPYPKRSSLLPNCTPQDGPRFDHLFSPVLPSDTKSSNVLHLSFENANNSASAVLVGLRDPLENRLILQYSDGGLYRITLPSMTVSPLVEHCLNALRQCLPRDATITLLTRWYSSRNSLGTQDITNDQEWNLFTSLLFDLLGYDSDHSVESSKDCPVTPLNSAKRLKQSKVGSDEDWTYVCISNNYKYTSKDLNRLLKLPLSLTDTESLSSQNEIQVNVKSVLFPYIKFIHFSFHLLYEDFKLNTLKYHILQPLAVFLCKLSSDLSLFNYCLYYWKDFPERCVISKTGGIAESCLKNLNTFSGQNSEEPVNVMEHISGLMKGIVAKGYPFLRNVNARSRDVVQLCGVLCEGSNKKLINNIDLCLNKNTEQVDKPVAEKGVSMTDEVVILMTKMKITTRVLDTFPFGIYLFFYSALWKCRENPPTDWSAEAYSLIWREDLAAQATKIEKEKNEILTDKYGMYSNSQLHEITPNIKHCDLGTLDGMEDIDNPLMKLRFPDDVRVSEARNMLQSAKPVSIALAQRPDVSDHDFIEEQEKHLHAICTRTMALPIGRGMFTLRTATPVITEPLKTPQLCLTGKTVPRGSTIELSHIDTPQHMSHWPLFHNGVANGLRITPDAHNIDSAWIVFNKPKSNEKHMEHGGFLMALGLHGHLRNLNVWNTYKYLSNTADMVSVGILLGLSCAFRGTCHSEITKTLSIHVEALLPPTSMELDINQTLQVAALMGIGLLYEGTAHRHMTEVLLSEIGRPPGPEMENSTDRESYSLAAGLALGLVTLKHGGKPSGLSDLNVPDTLHYYMVGGNKRDLTGTQRDKYKTASFQIREGPSVNLDVTAPGATLALGLMYLGTGNKAVADWMSPPETQYLLDFIRPDFLMLRILSKGLILWNDIEPTKSWIENQVPATIRPYCMVQPSNLVDIDYEAMNQAYCNIITGACFALGLKYAGSADEEAFKTLLHFCHMFTSLTGKSIAELAGKPTIETCLNVLLLSAAMVMAGTGNLEIMRLVRHLRKRVGIASSSVVTYGSHLAIHMALGLLFFGGGRYTLSNSPSSVAALICAFYPKFPTHSYDNRYHLQAFRHLYVLAAVPRLIIPKDVYLNKSCYANLKITKLDGVEFTLRGPGMLPDLDTLMKVEIVDDRYWPIVIKRGRNWDLLRKILSTTGYVEVKQRAGCLSYVADKYGYHSQLARTLTQSKMSPWDPSPSAIITFTSDESVKYFCDNFLNCDMENCSASELRVIKMFTKVTYDAVIMDKLVILPTVTALLKMIQDLPTNPSRIHLCQFKLILDQLRVNLYDCDLVSSELILALQQEVVNILESWEQELECSLRSYITGNISELNKDQFQKLATYTTFFDIPYDVKCDSSNVIQLLSYFIGKSYSRNTVDKIIKFCNKRL